jgi:hypothetical protein
VTERPDIKEVAVKPGSTVKFTCENCESLYMLTVNPRRRVDYLLDHFEELTQKSSEAHRELLRAYLEEASQDLHRCVDAIKEADAGHEVKW